MSALSPAPPARGGAGHDSTLRQCIALGNVGTCMETAAISAYVQKFQSYAGHLQRHESQTGYCGAQRAKW